MCCSALHYPKRGWVYSDGDHLYEDWAAWRADWTESYPHAHLGDAVTGECVCLVPDASLAEAGEDEAAWQALPLMEAQRRINDDHATGFYFRTEPTAPITMRQALRAALEGDLESLAPGKRLSQ